VVIDLFQKENKKLMIDGMVEAGIRVSRWAQAQGRDSDMVPPPDARVQRPPCPKRFRFRNQPLQIPQRAYSGPFDSPFFFL